MQVGYARTSTVEQEAGLEAQERDLKAAGCERVFSERVSSVGVRPGLDEGLAFVRDGDVVVVTKLDRLARSVGDLLGIVGRLEKSGVGLRVLAMGGAEVDTRTPTGRLMVTMLGAMAEFVRGIMLERQKEGIAKAKGEGKYRGRKPTAREKSGEVLRLRGEGLGVSEIVKELGIGRSSVHRILADGGVAAGKRGRPVRMVEGPLVMVEPPMVQKAVEPPRPRWAGVLAALGRG